MFRLLYYYEKILVRKFRMIVNCHTKELAMKGKIKSLSKKL